MDYEIKYTNNIWINNKNVNNQENKLKIFQRSKFINLFIN